MPAPRLVTMALATLAIAPTAVGAGDAWPVAGGDPGRGARSAAVGPQYPAVVPGWPMINDAAGPLVVGDDGAIYASGGSDNRVRALRRDGRVRWSFDATDPYIFFSSPAVDRRGRVLVMGHTAGQGGVTSRRYAFAPDGRRLPSGPALPYVLIADPALAADGTLYVTGRSGALAALDAAGKARWVHVPPEGAGSGAVALAPDGSVIHLLTPGSGPVSVTSLTAAGTVRWRIELAGTAPDEAEFSVGPDGTIYVASAERSPAMLGPSARLDAIGSDGQIRWTHRAPGRAYRPALGADGTVYVSTWLIDGGLTALGPAGDVRWRLPFAGDASRAAIGGDGTIYLGAGGFGTEASLLAVSAAGRVRWAHPAGGGDPVIGPDGTLYGAGLALRGAEGRPRVSRLRASGRRFRLECVTRGCTARSLETRLSFVLSRAADVDVTLRRVGDRRVVARYVQTAEGPTNTLPREVLVPFTGRPGPNVLRLAPDAGLLRPATVPPGRYVLTLRAVAKGAGIGTAAVRVVIG